MTPNRNMLTRTAVALLAIAAALAVPAASVAAPLPVRVDSPSPNPEPGVVATPSSAGSGEPCFTAAVEPRAAAPGKPVTVTFTSQCERFTIVDCLVFFPNDPGGQCRRSREQWIARTTVPLDAQPGTTVLRWGVASRRDDGRAGADNGGIAYQVLAPPTPRTPTSKPPASAPTSESPVTGTSTSGPPPAAPQRRPEVIGAAPVAPGPGEPGPPAFRVLPDPGSGAAGDKVTVSSESLVDGVTITGCSAGFTPRAMTSCRRAGRGWAAELTVPKTIQVGPSTLVWRLAYSRAGTAAVNDTDGLLTFTVVDERGWNWRNNLRVAGLVLAGGFALAAALLGRRKAAGWVRTRRSAGRVAAVHDAELPAWVRVVARHRADRMDLATPDRNAPAEHRIRIVPHRGADPEVRVIQEAP